jgi:outer membrane protein, heavy metal efflux system
MRRILFTYLVLTLVIGASRVRAGEQPELGDPLTLDAAVAYARDHNPEIRAARARQHAAQARPTQVGALPDPTLDLAYHNETFDRFTLGDSDFAWVRIGASQEIPFPGKLGLKADIARQTAKGTHAAAQRVEREVVSRVKIAYAEYAHLQEQHHLLERNRRLLENLARSAETKYAVGEGIQQDVVRAQLELSMIEDRAITLEQRSRSQTADLNALLNRPTTAPLGEPQHLEERHLTHSLDDLLAAAQLQAPELNVAASRIAASESGLALARRDYLPDFVVRADYLNKAALDPEWEVGIGVTLPLYVASKQRAGVQEAAAMVTEARQERDGTARLIEARVRDLFARAQASERLVALYHTTIIPQARLAVESANTAYGVNKVDFVTLLNSFTVMLEYEMRYHEELSNFQNATAQLEALVGTAVEG